MEENKAFTVKQSQVGDDSGYSCTSTQSKYSVKSCQSQSASSGYSYFEKRRSTTLNITEDRKMSTSNSKSIEQLNKNIRRDISGLETTTNPESSNSKSSKSEKVNVTAFEPQLDQLFSIDELKQLPSTSINMKIDESTDINDDTKEDHDRNNLAFLQLVTLCKSYRDYLNTKNEVSNPCDESSIDIFLKELNEHEEQLKEIIESNEVHDDSFHFVVSMNDGLIINTSNNIHKIMGYHKDMGQGRSFIDFIHPKDRISFISYVTSVLIDPCKISRRGIDGISTATFLKAKNNDGFYCNMRRYRSLNTGYSIYKNKNHYQVCKLTITFEDVSTSPTNKIPQSQLHLIVKAQLIHSAYTYPEEKKVSPMSFVTKHDALFEWCYVDHLIISHLGYLPQNIIGKSIFNYYNIEDLAIIKEIHENMTKPRSVPFKGNPYRFKCQNGDFALVQTEWSNFVNPWTGRVEFVIGKHNVIQGPVNPDVITPIDDVMPEATLTDDKTNPNEIYEDIKKLLNKDIYEPAGVSKQINHISDLSTNVKNQKSIKCKDLASYMKNCFVEDIDPSKQVPLEVKIQPETCGFSNHDSVILGEISPHTSKSSSGTPPSYTQLNYNDNILRFFKSNLQSNSSEDLSDQNCHKEITSGKVPPSDRDMDIAQQDKITLSQNVTPNSSIIVNYTTTNNYSEQNSKQNKNSQQPLTQKMLLRHNKKMEDDLVNQHKNNTKRIKSSVKQKKYLPDENTDTANVVTHGIKRNISSQYENRSCKLTKRKHQQSSPINVITQTQASDDIATTNTVARATQIWPPCKITRDSQTMVELSSSPPVLPNYNVPFGNNVMPGKHNEYKNAFTLIRPQEQSQESLSNQLQLLTVPLYASIPVMNHMPQSAPLLQPCLHYQNQILLQQPYQNFEFKTKIDPMQNETPIPILSKTFYQKTEGFQVNQEEIITSSDSEYSSFYSSILRYKTDSSDKEEYSWPPDFIKTNCPREFIKKQPFRMENVTTPDIIFRYQMEHGDINEVLQKDMNVLNTFTQPLLVNEQLKQLCVELNVNGTSKTSYYEDGSSSSGGDECLIYIGNNKKRKVNFSRMAMIYEENAPLPPPTTSPRSMSSNTNQSTT